MRIPPDITWAEKGGPRDYVVVQPVEWWIGKKHSGWKFTVPVGRAFESSVPPALRWAFSPDDPYFLKAAAVHDMLLEEGYRNAFADSQWFEVAMSVHAPMWRAWIAYLGMLGRRFSQWVLGRGR